MTGRTFTAAFTPDPEIAARALSGSRPVDPNSNDRVLIISGSRSARASDMIEHSSGRFGQAL